MSAKDPTPTPLQQFRSNIPRHRIHPLEKLLVWAISVQLVLLPWLFGGMRIFGQLTSLGIAVLGFMLALLPRNYDQSVAGQDFRLYTWPKLVRFPVFWLGLALLLIVVIGTLNPGWEWRDNGKMWWMQAIPHITWLPASVRVPFERWGPWRMLIVYSAALLPVCSVWIGFTRRRSFQALFTALVVNGAILAVLGMLQQVKGNGKVLWFMEATTPYFVATIPYKNHAAAYFNLILSVAAGLSFWHYTRSLRRLDKSSPSGIFAFAATLLAIMVVFSFSRGGTVLMLGFVAIILILFVAHQVRLPAEQRSYFSAIIVLLLLGTFVWLGSQSMKIGRVTENMQRLLTTDRSMSVVGREVAASATWEMARDKVIFGWGAGSFRFLFPQYQHRHKEITTTSYGAPMYWEHAHNDYAEFFAEFGLTGSFILAAVLIFAASSFVRTYGWQNPLGVIVAIGTGVTLIHAWFDFQFQNPAILTTWAVLLFGVIRWAQLEEQAGRG